MIVTEKDKDGNIKIVYKEPDTAKKFTYFLDITKLFQDYLDSCGISKEKVECDFRLINEINIRVDKRKDYYLIFHDTVLNEVKEAALMAFWILKFKPYLMTSSEEENYNPNINSSFAAYIILSSIREYVDKKTEGKKEFYVSEEYLERFKYSLKYWDLCKESLMLLAESLCESILNEGVF